MMMTLASSILLLLHAPGEVSSREIPPDVSRVPANELNKEFDGQRAYQYLLQQTRFGPRGPGLPGHDRCLRFLRMELGKLAGAVRSQEFSYTLKSGKRLLLTNLIASFNTQSKHRILLSAHWDTRLWADQDANVKNHSTPIAGANDGASGVAVLLEIAQHLKAHPPSVGVDLIFFDGEDVGTTGTPGSFCQGSRYFAKNKPADYQPRFGINIDMIGDRNLTIYREQNSERFARQIQDQVFSAARLLNVRQFIDARGAEVSDDHLPLNEAGIPTVNLIDFDYPDESNSFWHTVSDTPDKCSAASLEAVGIVILHIIYSQS
ncbi:MAG TPA: glutamine cyclotransferase [Bacteroidetes bacterium]|nr:glutamine cyclotransferase [Bacteroidota bacterium]